MQKYFLLSEEDFQKNCITNSDVFHIKNVMRNRIGDTILISYDGKSYFAKIKSILDKEVFYEIIEEQTGNHELPVFVSIFQGYPKSDKMEDIIKHGTELGASMFVPTLMKRSVVKLEENKKEAKLIRFRKIAKEAAEQSYRDVIPEIPGINKLEKIDFSSYDIKIVCYEENSKNGECHEFKRLIKSIQPKDRIAIVIGPEGGIDPSEIEALKKQGFICASIGNRILRTETVVFYCLSAISYEWELK